MKDIDIPEPVFAISTAKTNSELIEQIANHPLGYLRDEWTTLDATWGLGNFWDHWKPRHLIGSDLDPDKSPIGRSVDFRYGKSGFDSDAFDVVVIDPPYKLNGTSTGEGPSASDSNYGVAEYASRSDREGLQFEMLAEAARVVRPARRPISGTRRTHLVGGYVLCKGQSMVNGGRMQWTTRHLANFGEDKLGMRLVDELHLKSYRAQPPRCATCGHYRSDHPDDGACGRTRRSKPPCSCTEFILSTAQDHARRNFSTLLVFRLIENPPEPQAENTLAV